MTSITGKGIHTGRPSTVSLRRQDGPVTFIRGTVRIPAISEYVHSVDRSTVLVHDGEAVGMVEHLLAALYVRGWWSGLEIEVSAEEMPALDGSAASWLPLLDTLGTPPPSPEPFRVKSRIEVSRGRSRALVEPGPAGLRVDIDFEHPAIGVQSWQGTPAAYSDLLHARTFGLLSEQDALHAAGLALGADLHNTVVFGADGPLVPLRHRDEPVRHKALDALGDLYLFGRSVEASIRLTRPSHDLHARLVTALREAEHPGSAAS